MQVTRCPPHRRPSSLDKVFQAKKQGYKVADFTMTVEMTTQATYANNFRISDSATW